MKSPKVLVAPLNWGLGHATRCIPIIRCLLDQGATVMIGADGRPLDLLAKEFPHLELMRFPGMNIRYDGSPASSVVRHLPHIARTALDEHRRLESLVGQLGIDAVISDNRFGLYSTRIPSVYLTHQIGIMMPRMLGWARGPAAKLHSALISKYTECWIPDYPGKENLSAGLGHYEPLPGNSYYVGPLSRFRKFKGVRRQYDLIAILSGPEPQRTMLEQVVMSQIQQSSVKALVVRGVTDATTGKRITGNLTVVSYLTSSELNKAILASEVVLSRPGYSTIMDLAVLGSKAIFIPTPGQTEQEYLARLYSSQKIFYCERQTDFQLSRAMSQVRTFAGIQQFARGEFLLSARIKHLLQLIG